MLERLRLNALRLREHFDDALRPHDGAPAIRYPRRTLAALSGVTFILSGLRLDLLLFEARTIWLLLFVATGAGLIALAAADFAIWNRWRLTRAFVDWTRSTKARSLLAVMAASTLAARSTALIITALTTGITPPATVGIFLWPSLALYVVTLVATWR